MNKAERRARSERRACRKWQFSQPKVSLNAPTGHTAQGFARIYSFTETWAGSKQVFGSHGVPITGALIVSV